MATQVHILKQSKDSVNSEGIEKGLRLRSYENGLRSIAAICNKPSQLLLHRVLDQKLLRSVQHAPRVSQWHMVLVHPHFRQH